MRTRSTFSVAFYIRRTRLNKYGEAPIQLRITVDHMRADTSVKRTISPDLWNSVRGRANDRTALCRELNMYLDSIRAQIVRIHRELETDGIQFITAQMVLDKYLGRDKPERHTLVELFEEHNGRCRALSGIDMSPATVERYATCLKHTIEFMKHTYNKEDVYFDELDRRFIEDYEFYLKTVRKCCHNTATKYLKNFKKIILIALRREWLKKDPFIDIRFSLTPVDRPFLERQEIDKIYKKDISIERLSQVRDVFVFCCFTGLAFSDVLQLAPSNIVTDANGTLWIRKPRQKTKNICNIPLLATPKSILDKYKGNIICETKNVLLPVLSNQKMNAYLKELADICGINKQLTTHVARHTFATLMLGRGVSIESVAKMLGHSDAKMTRIYARVLDKKILEEMQKANI